MSEKAKQAGEALMEAFNNLPDTKKEFLLGYAEGVAAMAEKSAKRLILKPLQNNSPPPKTLGRGPDWEVINHDNCKPETGYW